MTTHLDLFSGIGGFALAARWAGLTTIAFCECELFCQAVLRKNFPGVPIHADVTTFDAEPLLGRVGLLTGGFPCQDISAAGKGAGLDGARSGLWFEMLRVIRECRPDAVLIENVPALKSRGADTVLCGLEEAGYTAGAYVVGADDIGASHRRKRVWIVAYAGHGAGRQERRSVGGRNAQGFRPAGYGAVAGSDTAMADFGRDTGSECNSIGRDGGKWSGCSCSPNSCLSAYPSMHFTNPREGGSMADTDRPGRGEPCRREPGGAELVASQCRCAVVADPAQERHNGAGQPRQGRGRQYPDGGIQLDNAERGGRDQDGQRGGLETVQRRRQNDTGAASQPDTRLPAFPPARNDFRSWAAVAEVDPALMPCVEREVRDVADGLSGRLVRRRRSTRNATLKGLGNAIVPQIAYLFMKAIQETLTP